MKQEPNREEVAVGTINKVLGDEAQRSVVLATSLLAEFMRYEVRYVRQGDFTVALLGQAPNEATFIGVSKRNPIDPISPLRGKALALSRAVRALVRDQLRLRRPQQKQTPLEKALVDTTKNGNGVHKKPARSVRPEVTLDDENEGLPVSASRFDPPA